MRIVPQRRGDACGATTAQHGGGTSAEIAGPDLARLIARPVNALLGVISLGVALHSGHGRAGALWFAASTGADILRAALQALGCPFLQGYHLGRPMPAGAILEMLPSAAARAA